MRNIIVLVEPLKTILSSSRKLQLFMFHCNEACKTEDIQTESHVYQTESLEGDLL